MNEEVVKQLTEITKNISVVFDGKLNSETLVSVVKEATPQIMHYLYFVQIKSFITEIVWIIGMVVSAYLVGKAIIKYTKGD